MGWFSLKLWEVLYAMVALPLSHTILYSKMSISLLEGTFSLEDQTYIQHGCHAMCSWKVIKNAAKWSFTTQNVSSNVLYGQQKSLWYHFSNFEHFLRTEIMMTSMAGSCERKWRVRHVFSDVASALAHLGRPKWRKWKFEEKVRAWNPETTGKWGKGKTEEMFSSCPPGSESWEQPWSFSL